ncbi:hypothetical protein CHARACLAT_011494, partial [Characodon lateralis]|nr:hypothetical protein [Characodon lateralis]
PAHTDRVEVSGTSRQRQGGHSCGDKISERLKVTSRAGGPGGSPLTPHRLKMALRQRSKGSQDVILPAEDLCNVFL